MGGEAFRFDLGALCLNFVGTVGSRKSGSPVERIATPERLRAWILQSGLVASDRELAAISESDQSKLIELREVLHRLIHDLVRHGTARSADIEFVNRASDVRQRPNIQLGPADRKAAQWRTVWSLPLRARDVGALIAADAIALVGSEKLRLLKECAGTTCDGIYVDASRGFNRTWCSTLSCGNQERVKRFRRGG